MQARSQGGSGGVVRPPQLPIPKILFHPLAILFHPLAILFHLSAILFHPLAILFHPSAILFHPWNMDDVTRAMSKGGVLVNVQEWGRFSNWWRHADNVQGGGAPGVPPIQVQTPPTWLAGWLRACNVIVKTPIFHCYNTKALHYFSYLVGIIQITASLKHTRFL